MSLVFPGSYLNSRSLLYLLVLKKALCSSHSRFDRGRRSDICPRIRRPPHLWVCDAAAEGDIRPAKGEAESPGQGNSEGQSAGKEQSETQSKTQGEGGGCGAAQVRRGEDESDKRPIGRKGRDCRPSELACETQGEGGGCGAAQVRRGEDESDKRPIGRKGRDCRPSELAWRVCCVWPSFFQKVLALQRRALLH
jgi:hypothetical protein